MWECRDILEQSGSLQWLRGKVWVDFVLAAALSVGYQHPDGIPDWL